MSLSPRWSIPSSPPSSTSRATSRSPVSTRDSAARTRPRRSVTDTGPGVAPGDRARVVERFVRLEHSRNAPGAGLGLSLVAAVAEAHGGRLELDEGPGRVGGQGPGLRVAVVLPAAV